LPALPALPGSLAEGGGEYPAAALVGAPAPVGIGHQAQSPDVGTELPGWSPGERAGQITWSPGERADQTAEQLAGWPGGPAAADQPPVTT
jgi:hypothetical protein